MSGIRLDTVALTIVMAAAFGSVASGIEGSKVQATMSDRTAEPGDVVRLDVICGCEATGATATVFGERVPLFPTGDGSLWSALIGVDLAVEPGTYPLTIVVEHVDPGPIAATEELSVIAKRFAVRRLSVAPRFVKLPENAIARIQNESRRLAILFKTATQPRQWHRPFHPPASAPISGGFGTRSVFNGQPRSPHSGVDFGSKAGSAVVAPAAGVVTLAEPLFFTGSTVVIDHGLGLHSLLAHLSAFAVKEGERIQRGQVVGFAGATGRVTGPHLHWSVRLNGARVDPLSLIALTNEPERLE
jgi:murein DD-endopeptidase MepM/ murein hydrolase activator NlpD